MGDVPAPFLGQDGVDRSRSIKGAPMSDATTRPSRWKVFAPDTAGAIYGIIAAMAVIAGTASGSSHTKPLSLTAATLLVFWLAHVYAQALSHHLRGARRLEWSVVREAMIEERPLLEGPVPLLVVLALGATGVLDQRQAIRLGHPLRPPPALELGHGTGRRRRQRAVRPAHRVPRGGRALKAATRSCTGKEPSCPEPPRGPLG
jgi:hypothetical protein